MFKIAQDFPLPLSSGMKYTTDDSSTTLSVSLENTQEVPKDKSIPWSFQLFFKDCEDSRDLMGT